MPLKIKWNTIHVQIVNILVGLCWNCRDVFNKLQPTATGPKLLAKAWPGCWSWLLTVVKSAYIDAYLPSNKTKRRQILIISIRGTIFSIVESMSHHPKLFVHKILSTGVPSEIAVRGSRVFPHFKFYFAMQFLSILFDVMSFVKGRGSIMYSCSPTESENTQRENKTKFILDHLFIY